MDDLEWASGGNAVRLDMRRDPLAATLSVHGSGDLKITLPVRTMSTRMQAPRPPSLQHPQPRAIMSCSVFLLALLMGGESVAAISIFAIRGASPLAKLALRWLSSQMALAVQNFLVKRTCLFLQATRLDGFHCAVPEVHHAYKHKHMKTAFSQLPQARDGSTAMSSKVQTTSILICCAAHPRAGKACCECNLHVPCVHYPYVAHAHAGRPSTAAAPCDDAFVRIDVNGRYAAVQVVIDANGLMKVTHMLSLGGGGPADAQFGAGSSGVPSAQGGMASSQRVAVTNRMAVIQFMLVSEDDNEGDEQ